MLLTHVVVLALVQGLTEFLPISSSAHLILVPVIAGWPDQGLEFDVAVHAGTLIAVVVYFRGELVGMGTAWLASLLGRGSSPEARLAWAVLWGTVPAGLAGLAFKDLVEGSLRSPLVIALATIVFGLALWAGDRWGRRGGRARTERELRWRDVLIVGCAQALALVPGTSRSGITMTAALAVGLGREAAARFSFLLAIPVIALAGLLEVRGLVTASVQPDWSALAIGTLVAGVSAFACIRAFLALVAKVGMLPFVLYRLALGGVLLALIAAGRL